MKSSYLTRLDARRLLLWSALLWYAVTMARHATADPRVWLGAAGIASVVGVMLAANAIPAGGSWRGLGFWPALRFFLIPFCVASFSSVMREVGLVVVFPRNLPDNLWAGGAVTAFLLLCAAARRLAAADHPRG